MANLWRKSDVILIASFALPFNLLASRYFLNFDGRFVPEVFFIVFAIAVYGFNGSSKRLFFSTFFSRSFLLLAFALLFLAAFGALRFDADLTETYARLRSLLCIAYGGCIVMTTRRIWGEAAVFEFLSVFLMASTFLFAISFVVTLLVGNFTKVPIPIFIFPILVLILLIRGAVSAALLVATAALLMSALSAFRQNYIYAGISLGACFFYLVTKSVVFGVRDGTPAILLQRRTVVSLILLGALIAASPIIFDQVWIYLSSDESRYVQSIKKFYELFAFIEGTGRIGVSESTRLEGLQYMMENTYYYLLPNGIINDTTFVTWSLWGGELYQKYNVSLVRDSSLALFVVTFGAGICLVALTFGTLYAAWCVINETETKHRALKVIAIVSVYILLFADGTAATQMEKAVYFGIVLALAFQKRAAFRPASTAVMPSLQRA